MTAKRQEPVGLCDRSREYLHRKNQECENFREVGESAAGQPTPVFNGASVLAPVAPRTDITVPSASQPATDWKTLAIYWHKEICVCSDPEGHVLSESLMN